MPACQCTAPITVQLAVCASTYHMVGVSWSCNLIIIDSLRVHHHQCLSWYQSPQYPLLSRYSFMTGTSAVYDDTGHLCRMDTVALAA